MRNVSIDPPTVNLSAQAQRYADGVTELRSLATTESTESVSLHSNGVEPLGIAPDINGALPFRQAGEVCFVDGDVQRLGKLSTGEVLVRFNSPGGEFHNNSCEPGDYLLLDQNGRPTTP